MIIKENLLKLFKKANALKFDNYSIITNFHCEELSDGIKLVWSESNTNTYSKTFPSHFFHSIKGDENRLVLFDSNNNNYGLSFLYIEPVFVKTYFE